MCNVLWQNGFPDLDRMKCFAQAGEFSPRKRNVNLNTKIPPPVVALLFAAAMWLTSQEADNPVGKARVLAIIACWFIGTCFSASALLAFRKAKTTVNPLKPQSATSLVVSGVFGLSRNPMYVGMAFILLAWSIYLGTALSLSGVVGFILFINKFQIAPEEKAMLALFGEEFVRYSQRVRRWL